MSKPGKVLKGLCKKLGIRLTVKRGKKRVYKSIKVLKRQCANKKNKKKKVKRKRRRKFGGQEKDKDFEIFEKFKEEYPAFMLELFITNPQTQDIVNQAEQRFLNDFMLQNQINNDELKVIKNRYLRWEAAERRRKKAEEEEKAKKFRRRLLKDAAERRRRRAKEEEEYEIKQAKKEEKEAAEFKKLRKERSEKKIQQYIKNLNEKTAIDDAIRDEQHRREMEDLDRDLRNLRKRSLYDIITGGPWQPKAMIAGGLVGGTALGLYYHSLKERDRKMAAELKSKNKKKIVKRKRKK